jgi:hypothetical protein
MPEGVDPAPLVDFCNQNSPRAQPLISRSPADASKVALLRAFQVASLRRLFQARPSQACPWSLPSEPGPCGPRALSRVSERAHASRASRPASRPLGPSGLPGDTNRAFTGQGPSALADDASRAEHPEGCAQRELRPNPIHSGTSCRGTVAAPAGEPGAIVDPTPQAQLSPDLPTAAPPLPPRRGARSAAPEVPSVHELPTCPWAGLSPGC